MELGLPITSAGYPPCILDSQNTLWFPKMSGQSCLSSPGFPVTVETFQAGASVVQPIWSIIMVQKTLQDLEGLTNIVVRMDSVAISSWFRRCSVWNRLLLLQLAWILETRLTVWMQVGSGKDGGLIW